jgi:hypothetical protein
MPLMLEGSNLRGNELLRLPHPALRQMRAFVLPGL